MDPDRSRSPADSLLDAIGGTPLVRLRRVAPDGIELLAKVEWYGPTGSVKDRIYGHMLTEAERRGDLRPGMTIIECTTGNAGIACAAVAAIKGYACTIVMPEGMSSERKRMIQAYGAELVLTPGAGTDIDLALARMREIVSGAPDRYFFPGEFENPDNPQAQLASGEEIWEQAGGRVDAVVGAQGTGGWISGPERTAVLRSASIVAVPSLWPEPFGLVGLEAAVHGVPAVAFDVGGIRQWLQDDVSGRIVSEIDDAGALGRTIAAMCSAPEELTRLGDGARRAARLLSLDAHLDILERVFSRAIAARAVPA